MYLPNLQNDKSRRRFVVALEFLTARSLLAITGEYTCQIDDERGVKTTGYLYVEGMSFIRSSRAAC